MAVYKVPQDVEAEDKLLGPFSFRQFIYLLITAGTLGVTFLLFRVFPLLAIIPLPIAVLFGILALPLRKDQPMETYLLAIIRFYLKPRLRLWDPDGVINYVTVVAPKLVEQKLTKDLDEQTAQERLNYLANVMDSRGWSLKGLSRTNANLKAEAVAEIADTNDIMDEHNELSKSFDTLLAKKDQERKAQALQTMQRQATNPIPASRTLANNPYNTIPQPSTISEPTITPHFNPYPSAMHQKIIQPYSDRAPHQVSTPPPVPSTNTPKTVPNKVSPDIMRLANNNDLSISAIAREAHRLEAEDGQEVVIQLH